MGLLNRCIWNATSSGTGNFVQAGAVPGFQTMQSAGAVDGSLYSYTAQSPNLLQWEFGYGTWVLSTQTLQRTIVVQNSAGGATPLNFTVVPQIMIGALAGDITGFPIPSNGDHTWYFSNSGSDSNPGTAGAPFANLQRGLDVAALYDWQHVNTPTIQAIIPNAFTLPRTVIVPPLLNYCKFRTNYIQGDTTTFSNVSLTFNSDDPIIFNTNVQATWAILGMRINSTSGAGILAIAGIIQADDLIFACGDAALEAAFTGTQIFTNFDNLQISVVAGGRAFAQALHGGEIFVQFVTLTFSGAPNFSRAFATALVDANISVSGMTYVNGGTVTGQKYIFAQGSRYGGSDALSSLPGSGGDVDNTSSVTNGLGGFDFNFFTQVFGAIPTASTLPAGCWTIAKDTGGGGVYVVANDGGTIKKVQLI